MGGAIATAVLFHWAVVTRVVHLPGWSLTVGWFGLMAGAALVAGWLQRRYTFGSAGGDAGRSGAARRCPTPIGCPGRCGG